MLPITLVLILLMRMDGMLMALRLQTQEEKAYALTANNYGGYRYEDASFPESSDDDSDEMRREQLILPYRASELSELERIKRCIALHYGSMGENMEMEEHDLMKDARTSFLPTDTTSIPRECLESLDNGKVIEEEYDSPEDSDDALGQAEPKRWRRTPSNKHDMFYPSGNHTLVSLQAAPAFEEDVNETDETDEFDSFATSSDEVAFLETVSALQSFWNEQGTKESIRDAQAKTMLRYMDQSEDPCVDFYKYACGNWEKLHPIPKDKAGFDTFEMLRENLDVVLRQLLESQEDVVTTAIKDKIKTLENNDFEVDAKGSADIVANADKASKGLSSEQLKEKEAALRRHIVQKRHALGQLLTRYRRQTTSSKRKRLISLFSGLTNSHLKPLPNPNPLKKLVANPSTPRAQNAAAAASTLAPSLVQTTAKSTVLFDEPDRNAQRKAKHLYQSCTNVRLLAKRGIEPLLRLIDSLGGWPVLDGNWNEAHFDWLNLTAHLRRYNNDILIVEWVGPDIKDSDENIIQFDQTSLGLPTREYFLQDVNAKYLAAYQEFMAGVMNKLGAPRELADQTASDLISFETQLASITSPADQRLNVTKLYKRMTLKELQQTIPEIDWRRYLTVLQDRHVRETEQVVIYATDYMQDLVALIADTDPKTLSNYLMWRFVRHRINNVDDRFEGLKQNFYHTLFGREASPSRWKVCIAQVNTNMGMALGSMFVSKYFDENSKRDTLKMTHELQQAFRDILKTTDWIDPNTKHLAELKVNAMSLKIGYPDFILNPNELNEKYDGIEINADKYFENTLNVLLHTSKTEQSKLYEAVNKTAWQTAPAIVNAYYSRNKNQIMFPAGILQPPFYHRHFPRSLNFGGIGVVIGHELTHGFDDKGRLFDRNGSIHKWWTDASIKGFDERARCIIAQYSNYTVNEVGISLNGESTQGENIADNGGIRQAFHAYRRWRRENPSLAEDENLPGIDMTGEQLFFLNFGQVWCGAMRPEAIRNKLNTAIHSPGRFRVIGTLSNSNDFAREFKCPLGSPMNPAQKCSVW